VYRDALSQRRERLLRLRDEVSERIAEALCAPRAKARRKELLLRLAALAERVATLPRIEDLEAFEAACDEAERARESFVVASRDEEAWAARFSEIGEPSGDAEPYTPEFSGFLFRGFRGKSSRRTVVEILLEAAEPRVEEMGKRALVDPVPDGLLFYFELDDVPFRLDCVVAEGDDAIFVESSVRCASVHDVTITIRPQRFMDDMLSTVGLRRDLSFGELDFDSAYFVSGPDDALRRVLTPEARAALVSIARHDPARLELAPGRATLALTMHQPLSAACGLLATIARNSAKARFT